MAIHEPLRKEEEERIAKQAKILLVVGFIVLFSLYGSFTLASNMVELNNADFMDVFVPSFFTISIRLTIVICVIIVGKALLEQYEYH